MVVHLTWLFLTTFFPFLTVSWVEAWTWGPFEDCECHRCCGLPVMPCYARSWSTVWELCSLNSDATFWMAWFPPSSVRRRAAASSFGSDFWQYRRAVGNKAFPNESSEMQHDNGVHLFWFCRFDRDWKKIEAFVGSKTVIQVQQRV